jgi:hypothetical protein
LAGEDDLVAGVQGEAADVELLFGSGRSRRDEQLASVVQDLIHDGGSRVSRVATVSTSRRSSAVSTPSDQTAWASARR